MRSVATQEPASLEGDVLKLNEAAALLRVDRKTLAKWAATGQIPSEKVGTRWRFRRSVILGRLDGNRRA